jgi:hypothetical protein
LKTFSVLLVWLSVGPFLIYAAGLSLISHETAFLLLRCSSVRVLFSGHFSLLGVFLQ